jgi:hypothetical protein
VIWTREETDAAALLIVGKEVDGDRKKSLGRDVLQLRQEKFGWGAFIGCSASASTQKGYVPSLWHHPRGVSLSSVSLNHRDAVPSQSTLQFKLDPIIRHGMHKEI